MPQLGFALVQHLDVGLEMPMEQLVGSVATVGLSTVRLRHPSGILDPKDTRGRSEVEVV